MKSIHAAQSLRANRFRVSNGCSAHRRSWVSYILKIIRSYSRVRTMSLRRSDGLSSAFHLPELEPFLEIPAVSMRYPNYLFPSSGKCSHVAAVQYASEIDESIPSSHRGGAIVKSAAKFGTFGDHLAGPFHLFLRLFHRLFSSLYFYRRRIGVVVGATDPSRASFLTRHQLTLYHRSANRL